MPTKLCKPPTPKRYFEMRALCPEIIASLAITDAQARAKKAISEQDRAWFIDHAETWVRWFHANSLKWRKKLDRENDDDRNFVMAFLNHWADAFVSAPPKPTRADTPTSANETPLKSTTKK
jgi:hypothetical protein